MNLRSVTVAFLGYESKQSMEERVKEERFL